MVMQGPISMVTSEGTTSFALTAEGPAFKSTGHSRLIWRRALVLREDAAFDDEAQEFVPLEKIVSDFLQAVPSAIEEFKSL